MEKRAARVSEAQWSCLLDFLERNPHLARSRGYNNSAHGRAESLRSWQEIANVLNAEGSGTSKSPKEWSVYVSNYKSKLKKVVADINSDNSGTGGGPPRRGPLSDLESRFLAILGPGFAQTAPQVSVNPFPDVETQQSSSAADIQEPNIMPRQNNRIEIEIEDEINVAVNNNPVPVSVYADPVPEPNTVLPRSRRQTRYRSRPLAPLDEARRILSQVEMRRAASDEATASALNLIGIGMNRLADVLEQGINRLADATTTLAEQLRNQNQI